MFIVFLKFAQNKAKAGEYVQGHNEWIQRRFHDGVFLLVGSLLPDLGGSLLAHNTTLSELQDRVNDDPFVTQRIVNAEIFEIEPKKADQRLSFLLG